MIIFLPILQVRKHKHLDAAPSREGLSCLCSFHWSSLPAEQDLTLSTPGGSATTYCLLFNFSVGSDSFATPWTVACQAPLLMGFPRQEQPPPTSSLKPSRTPPLPSHSPQAHPCALEPFFQHLTRWGSVVLTHSSDLPSFRTCPGNVSPSGNRFLPPSLPCALHHAWHPANTQ